MIGFTDIHTHCVYGVDDGAKTSQDMKDMLDLSYQQGVRKIYCTSHAEPGMRPFDLDTYQEHLNEGREYCWQQGYNLELVPGAELLYTPAMDAFIQQQKLITLGDSRRVLVEFVPDVAPHEIELMLDLMETNGYLPILAHIERYDCMKGKFPFQLKDNYDVQFQVNCRTVIESTGFIRRKRIEKWFKSGLIDYVATDMHNCDSRPPVMNKGYEALRKQYGRSDAERLTKATAFDE
ncbi:MAG: hypothetical protein IJ662_06545 [Clostridia bacterium]|nr:hypothetical protein [Clostridia bacterium]